MKNLNLLASYTFIALVFSVAQICSPQAMEKEETVPVKVCLGSNSPIIKFVDINQSLPDFRRNLNSLIKSNEFFTIGDAVLWEEEERFTVRNIICDNDHPTIRHRVVIKPFYKDLSEELKATGE